MSQTNNLSDRNTSGLKLNKHKNKQRYKGSQPEQTQEITSGSHLWKSHEFYNMKNRKKMIERNFKKQVSNNSIIF